jgi:hypothetical protein
MNFVFGLEKVDRWNPIIKSAIQSRSHPVRFLGFSNNEKGVLRHVSEKWVELYKKCISCPGKYFEN